MRNFIPNDFTGSGQYLVRADKGPNEYKDTSFLESITRKVGYCLGQGTSDKGTTCVIIDMSDGLTKLGYFDTTKDPNHGKNGTVANIDTWVWVPFHSKQDLCDYLNNPDHSQEYRWATHEEIQRVAQNQKERCRQ